MIKTILSLLFMSCLSLAEHSNFLTYSNLPMGTVDEPLLLRTFMPKGDLQDSVLSNHHLGKKSPKYNLKIGKDVAGKYEPITGLPAAIGVNYGKHLSYCWDTVECRLLYAWSDGFLNMEKYWGDPKRGNRQSFGYVPELVGEVFYVTSGEHPITVDGKAIVSPQFLGYRKVGNQFIFKFNTTLGAEIHTEIETTDITNTLDQHVKLIGKGKLDYTNSKAQGVSVKRISDKEVVVRIAHGTLKRYRVVKEKPLTAKDVSAVNGEKIFNAMACITCHSTDGSNSHGPSLKAVAGSLRPIVGTKEKVLADDAYLRESILSPNSKVVQGFPPNYMPPFKLKENELKSLVLYIKTLTNE